MNNNSNIMRCIIFALAVICTIGLSAQSTNKRTPQANAGKEGIGQVIDVPDNGCDFMILPQPEKKKRGAARKQQVPVDPYPNRIEAYICFEPSSAYYTETGLNILDSIYSIAFDKKNNKFYKMTIEAYDDAEPLNEMNASLARDRAVMIFNYFASREESEFIIKRTPGTYTHSCSGENELLHKIQNAF